MASVMTSKKVNVDQGGEASMKDFINGALHDAATNSNELRLPEIKQVEEFNQLKTKDEGAKNKALPAIRRGSDSKPNPRGRRLSIDPDSIDQGEADMTRIAEKSRPADAGKSIWNRLNSERRQSEDIIEEEGDPAKPAKFKKLARMIKTNLKFTQHLKDMWEDGEEEQEAVASETKAKGDALVFDPSAFKASAKSYGGLSARARKCLAKHPSERTDDELLLLRDVVERLKCFAKYPRKVKQELARVIYYENVDAGRVIIQQGHIGMSFYFIVSGAVAVKMQEKDKETGLKTTTILGELSEGSSFGELALLHNIRRQATIQCTANSELIRVDKDDFESVLRVSYEREWNERLRTLSRFNAFKGLSKQELVNCNKYCKLKEFQPNTVLYGDTTEQPDYVGFITNGVVTVAREVVVMKKIGQYGKIKYSLPNDNENDAINENNWDELWRRRGGLKNLSFPERHFWTVGNMGSGFYYGIGEDMTKTYLLCAGRVEVLFVPRVQFMKIGRSRMLEKLKNDLERALPSNQQLFKLYFQESEWEKYKREEVIQVKSHRNIPNCTRLEDVPYTIRIGSWRIGHDNM